MRATNSGGGCEVDTRLRTLGKILADLILADLILADLILESLLPENLLPRKLRRTADSRSSRAADRAIRASAVPYQA